MTDLAIFSYIGQDVRTLQDSGELWFVAADVATILGYSSTAAMTRSLDPDEKEVRTLHTLGGPQTMAVITEPGLFAAVIRSTIPQAREFKRWITHVVLPEIRQKGSYTPALPAELSRMEILTMAIDSETRAIAAESHVAELEPRAEAWNALASAEGDYSVGDAAKILARAGIPTGPTRLFAQLVTIKWTYRGSDGKPRAYADRVEKGYLSEKPQFHYHPGTGARVLDAPQVRVTVKGIERLRQRLHIGALAAVSA